MFGKHSVPVFVALICLLVVSAAPAWGQATNTGIIIGSVFDNTNAFVPGAAVSITQTTTGNVRSTVTDKSGRFVFADVDPGSYAVKVTKQGFSSTVIADQVVAIGTTLTENVKLEVGSISTTVTVTEAPGAELQTMNATVGTTLSGAIILNLPNTSRDASTLAVLQPGQNINGNVGGVATDQNTFQLDGGFATDDMSGDNNTYIAGFGSDTAGGVGAYHSSGYTQAPSAVIPIPVSSIEEFKISTANQTADFNGGAGSQMQLETKRGTNALHGSVYDYYQDTAFGGANTWDNNETATPITSSHFSRFGADAGGKIPHSDFLGGSWFLFGNYEGYRFPSNSTYENSYPLPSLRAGIIHLNNNGTINTYNLNPTAVVDPGCGTIGDPTDCDVTTTGQSIPGSALDPRGLGLNPVICTPGSSVGSCSAGLWSYLPLPNFCNQGDQLNYCGYKGTISTPQSSNFGVIRVDHDFAAKWHFNGTYHYYNLSKTVADQWDIGGFFPGDTQGQYAAIRHKPQIPWLYTAGLTTEISSNVTNNVRFSFTRNFWAYEDPSGVPNVAGYPAALEVGGETGGTFQPYNTNNQNTRTRFWDGKDILIGDDVSWIRGNHLFQFGGSYLRNNDTHNRNDNGESINTYEQYLVGAGFSANLAGYGLDITGSTPAAVTAAGNANNYGNLYSMVLGMVDETQSLFSRGLGTIVTGLPLNPSVSCAIPGIAATADCTSSPHLVNNSIIPTYNIYFTDSWHMKPTFSLNYGIGYTVEMPPYETQGGVQTVMVDQNDNIFRAQQYLANVESAALQGNAYAPLIGFATVRNVNNHTKYPYDPFYGGITPRIGFAWNVRPDTVVRGGYARIYGRINGVNPILVPMLTPGLLQPDTCGAPNITTGGCGGTTPLNNFRVGVDCPGSGPCSAPLPAPSASLPQPWYPGQNDIATGSGETIDANFRPDRSDEVTLSVQHQFGPKIMAEAGYIGRKLSNEIQYYSLSAVPYMMTRGGQTFANAWKNVMVATNYGTDVPSPTLANGVTPNPAFLPYINSLAPQPFFENALTSTPGGNYGPGGYCGSVTGATSCTAAFVGNTAPSGLMGVSDAFDSWGGVSNTGGFNFGRSFTSDPVQGSPFGANGQTNSLATTVSNGFGNYNAGYLQLNFTDYHGLTAKTNFSWANALGTGDVVQASSSYASVDAFNLRGNDYGPQYYQEKFTFNLFLNYAPKYYSSQNGVIGHLLGGWSFSPLFVAGGGFPIQVNTANGDCGSFGECNTNYIFAYENMVLPKGFASSYSATRRKAAGSVCGYAGAGYDVFSDPDASCPQNGGNFNDAIRNPILGLDQHDGGGGILRGLPFWNLDLGLKKNIKINERFSASLYSSWTNVLNHMQAADPCFSAYSKATWGVLGCGGNLQANSPRLMQLGATFDF